MVWFSIPDFAVSVVFYMDCIQIDTHRSQTDMPEFAGELRVWLKLNLNLLGHDMLYRELIIVRYLHNVTSSKRG